MSCLLAGGFGVRGVEGKIKAAKWARENNKPFLGEIHNYGKSHAGYMKIYRLMNMYSSGICLGFQAAVIEFARNQLEKRSAHSMEADVALQPEDAVVSPTHPIKYSALHCSLSSMCWHCLGD